MPLLKNRQQQPSRFMKRLLRLSQAELVLQADASMFSIGRAVHGSSAADLLSARKEVDALQAVIDALLERMGS